MTYHITITSSDVVLSIDKQTTLFYSHSLHDSLPISPSHWPFRSPRRCTRSSPMHLPWRVSWSATFPRSTAEPATGRRRGARTRSEEHTSELQSSGHLVSSILLE